MLHEKKNVETPKKKPVIIPAKNAVPVWRDKGTEHYPGFQIPRTTWGNVSGLRISPENGFCIGYNRPVVLCFQSEQDFPLKG